MFSRWAEIVTNFLFAQHVVRPEGSCQSDGCNYTAEVYAWRTDHDEPPCDDFFDHICGSYYPGNYIPNMYVNTVYDRELEIDKKIWDFLNEWGGPAQVDPAFSTIYSFRQACTDMTTVQSLNFKQIGNELNFLGLSLKWPFLDGKASDETFATDILARLHTTSVGVTGFLFKMSVEVVDLGSDYKSVIKIEEASDPIIKSFDRYKYLKVSMRYYLISVIQEFHKYLDMELTSEEEEIFQDRALQVTEFLFNLKIINETPNEIPLKVQPMDVKSFQDFIDGELTGGQIQLDWKKFLKLLYALYEQSVENIVESKEEMIILYDVVKFKKTLQLLRNTNYDVFVSTMWWIAIDTLLYQSAHPFHQYHKIYENYEAMFLRIDRKRKCLNWIRRHFPLFVAHILAKEKDNSSIKKEVIGNITNFFYKNLIDKATDVLTNYMVQMNKKVEEMVTNIKTSFSKNLHKIGWLTWLTRNQASKKLKKMNFVVGYTDSILQSSSLEEAYGTSLVEYTNFLPTLCELFKKERKKNLLLLVSLDTSIDSLYLNTPEVQVKYNPQAHSLTIPMSILRFPFYNLGLDVLNYGAVGVHIAYGLARAFDYLWIKSSTKNLVECFETVYGTLNLRVIKRCADGELTVFSNIADTIAFKVSMDAYKIRAQKKGYEQTLPVYKKIEKCVKKLPVKKKNDEESSDEKSPADESSDEEENNEELIIEEEKDEQLFIRAFGNALCERATTEYYLKKSESSEQPLNRARVNGVLMNTNIFAKKWKCSYNTWMNPQQKCKIFN